MAFLSLPFYVMILPAIETYPKISFENTEIAFSAKSNAELEKAYWLFKLMSNPSLVKMGKFSTEIAVSFHLPVIWLIKSTIFKQFCGGESLKDCDKTVSSLAKYNIKSILDYSVEGKQTEHAFDATAKEIIATIHKAATNKRNIPFAVFKVTGIARFELLKRISANAILNESEQKEFERVKLRMINICQKAYELEIPVMIDAEESWIQQAIDSLAEEMMQLYNKQWACVFNTLQMYRWDRLAFLKQAFTDARQKDFILGVKLVRGAYMEKERLRARRKTYESPIHKEKNATDKDFDLALKFCVDNIHRIAVFAGTHNESSSFYLTELLKQSNISKCDERIWFSQLYGMSDHISYNLAKAGYNVVKYVPYGPVREVIPYLIRRAQENTSIAGQTGRELSLILKEKQRRHSKN
jgi:proline dehydrogenase